MRKRIVGEFFALLDIDPEGHGAVDRQFLRIGEPGRIQLADDQALTEAGGVDEEIALQPLAILESDVLLTRLLAREPVLVREPTLGWDDLIEGYTVRDMELRLAERAPGAATA